MQLLFERIGFKLLNRWHDADALARPHRQWATMLFELESSTGSRPIDTIESILNNDLWNLLPADSQVNGNKRDKLPLFGTAMPKRKIIFALQKGKFTGLLVVYCSLNINH